MLGLVAVAAFVIVQFDNVIGHGRLIEPASRNAMWRFKYKNPRNYNDMGLNCGGFTTQFEKNGGQCGVCGDSWTGEREHEAGGKYANGVIARQYKVGSFINVTVTLTSNHMGYFEFRLCPVNNPRMKATQACLDQHLLNIAGHGTRYFIMDKRGYVNIQMFVMLPPNLACAQCVFQWKYVAGQSMGPDGYGGECLGCGNQEHFVNCADIAIGNKVIAPLPQTTTPRPPVTKPPPQHNNLQVLTVGLQPQGGIPTIHAYGHHNHVPSPTAVGYNTLPIAQPPTAPAQALNPQMQVHGWGGSQANIPSHNYQQAQVTYKTVQEVNPQPMMTRAKVQIVRKPNPYAQTQAQAQKPNFQATHRTQQRVGNTRSNSKIIQKPNPYAQIKTQRASYPQVQPQPPQSQPPQTHFNPQANAHAAHAQSRHQVNAQQHVVQYHQQPKGPVPQAPQPALHPNYLQSKTYVPHQPNNHAVQTTSYTKPNAHAQHQNHVPQVPTYPQQVAHPQQVAQAPQPPALAHVPRRQAFPQPTNQIPTSHPQLQSKSYAPAGPTVQASGNVANFGNNANSLKNMKADLMKLFPNLMEGFDWMGDVATPTPTDPTMGSYPGYEPGEYPEPGESPPTQSPGSSGGQSSSYMQGYNDAMRELKRKFGISSESGSGSASAGKKCPGGVKPTCRGINQWQGKPQFDSWCTTTCTVGECPSNFCSCTCPGSGSWKSGPTCKGVDPAKGSSMDTWCTLNCKGGNCPSDICVCF